MKKAIIVGHSGQDGTYLSQLLQKKKYQLIGLSSKQAVATLKKKIAPVKITDSRAVNNLIRREQPDEIYFLAAVHQSSSDKDSDEGSLFRKSIEINLMAPVNFLESIRLYSPHTRLFYAASSHVFGKPETTMQDEHTPFAPDCIYGTTKTAGIHSCRYYREQHGVFACAGIFYNHESPLRPSNFVSKKIVEAAVSIKKKKQSELVLGNLKAKIDWGYAPDYMDAAWRMMKLPAASDFIISSGEIHTVKDFVQGVFEHVGLSWTNYVREDRTLITKKPKDNLFGNNHKLTEATGWTPKVDFNRLIQIMVNAELKKYE